MLNSVDFLFSFIEGMPVGIACADTTGKMPNHFNTYFLNMFGWDADEIDTLEKWFEIAYPDEEYRNEVITTWGNIIAKAQANHQEYSDPMEAKVACKDGGYKWCEVRYYGKNNYMYGIFTDISERKNIEIQLRDLSLIDPLTNIYNRRYFNITYYDRWNLSKRSQTPMSLIMCDIDNFKQINDTYGHLIGDQVLSTMAKAISNALKRTTDFIARYGGEEFIIVCYDYNEQSAMQLCQLIKNEISKIEFTGIKEANNCCTMSYGIATTIANESITPEQFINNADMAMYKAKKEGKNKIVVYEESLDIKKEKKINN